MDSHPPYGQPPRPPYVMLNGNGLQPPPSRRNLPRYYSRRSDGGGGCGCMCWCCCFLLLILVLLAAALVYIFAIINPKAPSYKFEHMGVGAFDVHPDFSLHTEFQVTVKTENPNKNIAISYGKDSLVEVLYKGANLCSGELPVFYQGHENSKTLQVVLTGDSSFGSGLQAALMDNKQSGRIPLDIYVRVPVGLHVWKMEPWKMKVFVHCALVVDNLAPNKKVGIKSAEYKYRVSF